MYFCNFFVTYFRFCDLKNRCLPTESQTWNKLYSTWYEFCYVQCIVHCVQCIEDNVGLSDVIYGFHCLFRRRRHFPYIGAHLEKATLLNNLGNMRTEQQSRDWFRVNLDLISDIDGYIITWNQGCIRFLLSMYGKYRLLRCIDQT